MTTASVGGSPVRARPAARLRFGDLCLPLGFLRFGGIEARVKVVGLEIRLGGVRFLLGFEGSVTEAEVVRGRSGLELRLLERLVVARRVWALGFEASGTPLCLALLCPLTVPGHRSWRSSLRAATGFPGAACDCRTSGSTCASRSCPDRCASTSQFGSCGVCTLRKQASRRFGLLREPLLSSENMDAAPGMEQREVARSV